MRAGRGQQWCSSSQIRPHLRRARAQARQLSAQALHLCAQRRLVAAGRLVHNCLLGIKQSHEPCPWSDKLLLAACWTSITLMGPGPLGKSSVGSRVQDGENNCRWGSCLGCIACTPLDN